jgi:outer membrane protein assembly factor BamD (BamD/ComL family)
MTRRLTTPAVPLAMLVIGLFTGLVRAELVGHWKFDEGSGAIAYDSSFYGNNGILEGGPKRVAGYYGGALEFDGDCWLYFDTPPDLVVTEVITIACWIKPAKLDGDQGIVGLGAGYAFKTHGKGVRFTVPGILDHTSASIALEVGTWQHVAVVFQAGQREGLAFYVNGVQTERMTSSTINRGTGPFLIGTNQWNETYTGLIDHVCVYNHALDEDEIRQLYSRGDAPSIPGGYVAQLAAEAEDIVKELEPKEAAALIEKKISEYERWRTKNLGDVRLCDKWLASDVYVLLARAKEAAGAPAAEVFAAYRQSLSRPHKPSDYVPAALLWLYEKVPTKDYTAVVRKCVRNSDDPSYSIYHISEHFQKSGNWAAFALFLDAIFSETDDPTSSARIAAKGLGEDGAWAGKFLEYCRSKPELTTYLFHEDEKVARKYIAQKDFAKAAETYRNIVSQCGPYQQKTIYRLKLSECLLNGGQYDSAIHEIDSFFKDGKTTNQVLTCKAIMLRGRAYVQAGDLDRATDAFFRLTIEHPEAKEAPEANFFVGYCHMLQSRFGEATEAFNIVVKDYPESSYADKARSDLTRIKNMTE